jgi:hypothetical protein
MSRSARQHEPVTVEELEHALVLLAHIMAMDGDVYAPIFERLDRELYAARQRRDTMARAREIAQAYTIGGGVRAIR